MAKTNAVDAGQEWVTIWLGALSIVQDDVQRALVARQWEREGGKSEKTPSRGLLGLRFRQAVTLRTSIRGKGGQKASAAGEPDGSIEATPHHIRYSTVRYGTVHQATP